MDETTLKTIENAVVICAEHSKNSATNATAAIDARKQIEKAVAGFGETEKNIAAQAQRAEEAVEATETAQEAVAEYVDNTFPAKVTEAEKRLGNATTEGKSAVTQTANQAISALDNKQTAILGNIDTKANEVSTALDGKVTEANQAKTDAVKARGEAEGFKGDAEKSAKSASESAEQASTSAQQAEDAKDAIGDVGERLDAVETLDGVFERRDILGELQKVFPAETANFKHANIAIRNVVTTANGNIVAHAQHINTWTRLYVIGKDGTVLAEQMSAHGMESAAREWLVQSGDAFYFLTKTVCYKITDTETSATIESIGNLDLNGLVASLPDRDPAKVLEIDGKVILSTLVIDLATLKVVQVLASGIVATHKSNGCYATLANGTVTKLTVSTDGLIEQADFVDSNGNAVQKNASVIEVSKDEMFGFIKPSATELTTLFVGYKHVGSQYGKSATQPMKSVVSRGVKLISIATNGNLLMNSAKRRGAATEGVLFNSIAMQMSDAAFLVGIDNGGAWAMGARTYVWAGWHPTSALVRVKF